MADGAHIFDITPRITDKLGVWPGDTPLSREVLMDMQRGDGLTLSTLRATVHLGAHADGPNHYGKDAPAIDSRSLDYYLGLCQVIRVNVARGTRVTTADVAAGLAHSAHSAQSASSGRNVGQLGKNGPLAVAAPRVLIATGTFPDPHAWNNDFAALEPALIDDLHAAGVMTVGIDTPSVDLMESKDLPAHAAFLRNDMAILEGLVLADISPGVYELIALPLPLVGFDASPVRAVLRTLD